MKHHYSLILAAVLLLSASITACSENAQSTDMDSAPQTDAKEITAETEPEIPITQVDYGGAEYRILTAAEQWQNFYLADQTGDAVDDAVYERNKAVEERCNITLDYQVYNGWSAGQSAVKTALVGSVMGGSTEFDLMVASVSYITYLIPENLFTDIRETEIDLTAPWWYQDINAELELNGRLFVAAGSYGMQSMSTAVVTFFNKKLIADYELEDPYRLVNDGKWTIDKLMEMGETVTTDLNGDGKYNRADRIGMLSSEDYMAFLPNSWGHFYTTRSGDGGIFITEASERLLDMSRKLNEIAASDAYLNIYPDFLDGSQDANVMNDNMMKKFAADEALFVYHKLELATKATARNKEEYGILPAPKFDETQEKYYTPVVNEVSAIPMLVKDETMSAAVMDALQYYTYAGVRPVYYDIALKRKATRDNDSEAMLDIIMSSLRCDFAYMYMDLIGSDLLYGITNKNYASYAEKNYGRFQKSLDQFMNAVNEMK